MASSSSSLLFPLVPLPTDGVETETTEEQSQTEAVIRELLALYIPQPGKPASSVPLRTDELALNRKAHIRWLKGILSPLPAPYTSLDASRPWLVYWVAHSLALLGTRLDAETRKKAIATLKSFYHATEGGFGGGPGQMAHLAPTYATVSALCYLGDGSEDWDWIDRCAGMMSNGQ
ncbi:CAAX farnesyltransferase (FTase) subunit beta [Cystobasidiomycetes sp. EMM_F5]